VISAALNEVEEELGDAAIAKRPAKNTKALGSAPSKTPGKKGGLMAMSRSKDYSTNINDSDEDEAEDDCEETTVGKFNKLRCLEGKARLDEIAKYLGDDREFSLLNFLSKKSHHPCACVSAWPPDFV